MNPGNATAMKMTKLGHNGVKKKERKKKFYIPTILLCGKICKEKILIDINRDLSVTVHKEGSTVPVL